MDCAVTNLQQRVVHLGSNSSGAYTNKGYLPEKSMIPKNFTDKADEWRSWQVEVADFVDTTAPGMKKVLAEIDQETEVIDDLWRRARETKYGEVMEGHTNLSRLLRRMTGGESKKVVMSIKDEDGGLAARQGIVMAELSGMVARPAKSPGENYCIVDRDGPQDEVGGGRDWGGSQRDAHAVSTGGQPGSNSAGPAKDTVTYPGTVPRARARAKARTTSYERRKSNYDGNKGSKLRDVQERWKGQPWSRQGVPEG